MSIRSKFGLKNEEEIVRIVRTSKYHFFWYFVLVFAVFFVNAFFTFWFWNKGTEGRIFYFTIWLLGAYLFFHAWLKTRANYFVVTTERIFDVQQRSWFREKVAFLHYFNIEDVIIEREGPISTIFNFGSVTIHPKDGRYSLSLPGVPNPVAFQNYLKDKSLHFSKKIGGKDSVIKEFIKLVPELTETELTILYQKIHERLLVLAGSVGKVSGK